MVEIQPRISHEVRKPVGFTEAKEDSLDPLNASGDPLEAPAESCACSGPFLFVPIPKDHIVGPSSWYSHSNVCPRVHPDCVVDQPESFGPAQSTAISHISKVSA